MWRWCVPLAAPAEDEHTTDVWLTTLVVLQTEKIEGMAGGRGKKGGVTHAISSLPRASSKRENKHQDAYTGSKLILSSPTHLISLPESEALCRIRALSSLSALLSTPDIEEEVDQEASLRGGRSLSEPKEAVRLCLLRPSRLRDLDDGVDGFTRWASYACFFGGGEANTATHVQVLVTTC